MILLSSTSDSKLTIIGGIIIILGFAVTFFVRLKLKSTKEANKSAEEFIKGLSDEFYSIMVKIIQNIDFSAIDISSLEEYEAMILEDIYSEIYDYTKSKLEEAAEDDILSTIALQLFTKKYISKFADKIFENGHVESLIKDSWSKYFESKINFIEGIQDVAIGHDIDGNEIIYSGDDYNEDFDEKNDLPVAEDEIIDQEALSKVIPPSDNEETPFNEDVIETDEDDLSYYIDNNGRKRDKKTGKFVK